MTGESVSNQDARWVSLPLVRWALLSIALALTSLVVARPVIDCPLRDQPYSIDTPLIDILQKPEAVAVLREQAPAMLEKMPAGFDQVPSYAAITNLRLSAGMAGLPEGTLAEINRRLTGLPVTAADRDRRCARYDIDPPHLVVPVGHPRLLVFEKITGFRDAPSVEAAHTALQDMARRRGWAMVFTDKGGVMTPYILKQFDAVIWNNVSGDALTLSERESFRNYIEGGGGFAGFHGSGGDSLHLWDWYVDTLLGARFKGHPMNPQFQSARVVVDDPGSGIVQQLAPGWTMSEEWYSFTNDPRSSGAHVLATLDEGTYSPIVTRPGAPTQDLHMGDHPIAWTRCVGSGRSFYSAIGHRPESYTEPHAIKLLEDGIAWSAGDGKTLCQAGKEVHR